MKRSFIAFLAVAALAAAAHAASDDATPPDPTLDASDSSGGCIVVNGKDGLNNQGANSGNGGKGLVLSPGAMANLGCVNAKGGNGGSNNRGANSGNGGAGVSFDD